ncbi:MAG: GNAT family N-acetyltransferase [Oscillospiraceae bacterium]|nr:GNAT family N-acetyltransferase [Oscillospiraceae bacterium]
MIQIIEENELKSQIAKGILYQLPEWFGVPESTNEYVDGCKSRPVWADIDHNICRGFIALNQTSPVTAEIYVMGVLPKYHRQGIGKELLSALQCYAKTNGYHYLQVKTCRKGAWESYDKTNKFYCAMGFEEFECFRIIGMRKTRARFT